jgi:hypothetical protein
VDASTDASGSLLALPLGDPFISRKPLVLEPGAGGGVRLRLEEEGMRVQVGNEPPRGVRELGPEALAAGVPLVLAERVVLLLHLASSHEGPLPELPSMVGQSMGPRRVREEHRTSRLTPPETPPEFLQAPSSQGPEEGAVSRNGSAPSSSRHQAVTVRDGVHS